MKTWHVRLRGLRDVVEVEAASLTVGTTVYVFYDANDRLLHSFPIEAVSYVVDKESSRGTEG
jgi:hypothetical protein